MKILIIFGVESCLFQVVTSLTQPWYIHKCVCCRTLSPSVTLSITDSTKQTSILSPKDDLLLEMRFEGLRYQMIIMTHYYTPFNSGFRSMKLLQALGGEKHCKGNVP